MTQLSNNFEYKTAARNHWLDGFRIHRSFLRPDEVLEPSTQRLRIVEPAKKNTHGAVLRWYVRDEIGHRDCLMSECDLSDIVASHINSLAYRCFISEVENVCEGVFANNSSSAALAREQLGRIRWTRASVEERHGWVHRCLSDRLEIYPSSPGYISPYVENRVDMNLRGIYALPNLEPEVYGHRFNSRDDDGMWSVSLAPGRGKDNFLLPEYGVFDLCRTYVHEVATREYFKETADARAGADYRRLDFLSVADREEWVARALRALDDGTAG